MGCDVKTTGEIQGNNFSGVSADLLQPKMPQHYAGVAILWYYNTRIPEYLDSCMAKQLLHNQISGTNYFVNSTCRLSVHCSRPAPRSPERGWVWVNIYPVWLVVVSLLTLLVPLFVVSSCSATVSTRQSKRHSPNATVMLGDRLRRWPNITAALGLCLVFTGKSLSGDGRAPGEISLSYFACPADNMTPRADTITKWLVRPGDNSILKHCNSSPLALILWNSKTLTSFVFTELPNTMEYTGEGVTLLAPSDVTAFHRMKYGGEGLIYNLVFTEWRHCVSQNTANHD